jgi:AbrB family looped-hinge helix DNA binding protein
MKSAVSEKGQVTIPKAVRERLGLRPGTLIEFRAENGHLVGTKLMPVDVLRKWRGCGRLPGNSTVDEYLARARGIGAHGG